MCIRETAVPLRGQAPEAFRATDFTCLIAVTVGINWLVKPFSMALLGWLFIGWLFRPFLPAGQIDSYIAGLIILAAAPCTAMVFVWSNLTDGDPNFTLSQVALNDTIMVFAFAPIVGLLLGLSSIAVPWQTLFLSVVLYIVVPVVAAQLWRRSLLAAGGSWGGHWGTPSQAAVGYGSRTLSNSGCTSITAPGYNTGSSTGFLPGGSCGAQNRDIQEYTAGYWYDFYKGDHGRFRQSIQYSYTAREGWSGASGIGAKGIDNMFWTSLRYYLP